MHSVDSGGVGRNKPVLPSRTKQTVGADKPAVKTKPRSNTLPNPTVVSSEIAADRKVEQKQVQRTEVDREENKQLGMGTGEQEIPSSVTPTKTWTNDLTATDANSEQLRGNQVPHPSE